MATHDHSFKSLYASERWQSRTLISYRALWNECFRNYTGQASRTLASRIQDPRMAIRDLNIKAALMASFGVNGGHHINLAETKILNHANSWTVRFLKKCASATKTWSNCSEDGKSSEFSILKMNVITNWVILAGQMFSSRFIKLFLLSGNNGTRRRGADGK